MNSSYHSNPPSAFVADELNQNHQPLPSISSSSSSSRTFFGSDQDPDGPYSPRELLSAQQRSEDGDLTRERATHLDSFQYKENMSDDYYSSGKWLPSKIRIIRKMMSSNKAGGDPVATNSDHKFEDQKRFPSPPAVALNVISKGSSYRNNDSTVRVCSDCNTTKTPLWRSGPRGPKSLCNACGIRQRKARRALAAAAAAANGTILPPAATTSIKFKVKSKNKKPRIEGNNSRPLKKRWKHSKLPANSSPTKKINNFWYEDFTSSILSKHYSMHQRVFPQDEREAAILLMALSYGLVRA